MLCRVDGLMNSPAAGLPEIRPRPLSADLVSEDGVPTPPSSRGCSRPLHPRARSRPKGRGFSLGSRGLAVEGVKMPSTDGGKGRTEK